MHAHISDDLFGQLERAGYSARDRELVRGAYRLAEVIFAGHRTSQCRSQMAHVVGTASILAGVGAPASVVAAGLVHNAYETGDYGRGRPDGSWRARWRVRRTLGGHVARHVRRFPAVKRAANTGDGVFDARDRDLLLIVLADWLEHRAHGEPAGRNGERFTRWAERLGHPQLAREMRALLTNADTA
jgi:hypothetical protein